MSGIDTLNLGWIEGGDTEIASFLRNTAGLVNIRDSSLAPAPGDTLIAIDATNAAWGPIPSGTQDLQSVLSYGNTTGAFDIVAQQKIRMPNAQPTTTTNLLNVTTGAGAPTSAGVQEGSLYYDSVANLMYIYDTTSGWITGYAGGGATPALSAVLGVGSTTGANNISVNSGQQLGYAAGIRIGGNASVSGASTATGIVVGNASTTVGNTNALAIGNNAVANGLSSTVIGNLSTSSAIAGVAVGFTCATGSGTSNVAIGSNVSTSTGGFNICVGSTSTITALGDQNTAIGAGVSIPGNIITSNNLAIGNNSGMTGNFANRIAIGSGANTTGTGSIAIGQSAINSGATGTYNICLGQFSGVTSTGDQNLVIGPGSSIAGTVASTNNIAIGPNVVLTGNVADRIIIGRGANGTIADNISIGRAASSSGTSSIALGSTSVSSGANGVALGISANCLSANGIAIGGSASSGSGASNTVIGQNSAAVLSSSNSVIVGQGSSLTTSPSSGCVIVGQGSTISAASTDCAIIGRGSTITSARTRAVCLGSGIAGANVTADDSIYTPTTFAASAAGTAVSWDASGRLHPNTSSIRYKQNLHDYEPEADILQIVPKTYNFKKGYCGCNNADCDGLMCDRLEVGFVAEEMQKLFPLVCTYSRDDDGNKRVESIQYDRLVLLLIPEVKRLRDRIEVLERLEART